MLTKPSATDNKPKKRGSRLFTVSIMLFVSVGSLAYALVDIAGVNAPRYYPLLRTFSNQIIEDEIAMGHYGRFLSAIILGAIAVLIYLPISSLIKRFDLLHTAHVVVVMTTALWTSIALIILQEWHHWSNVDQGFDGGSFFDGEFLLLFVTLNILFFGILFNAGFEHRLTKLMKLTRLEIEGPQSKKPSSRDRISQSNDLESK